MTQNRLLFVAVLAGLAMSCRSQSQATVKDLEFRDGDQKADGTGQGFVQWDCLSRRYGAAANTDYMKQDEYCEWKRVDDSSGSYCEFTTSMEEKDAYHLHLDNTNSLSAARTIVNDCLTDALKRLKESGDPGHDCEQVGCVAGRNSDPHICDEVRQIAKRVKTEGLSYRVVDLDPSPTADWSPMALMKLMPIGDLPSIGAAKCAYIKKADGTNDLRHVRCPRKGAQLCSQTWASKVHVGLAIELKAKAGAGLSLDGGDGEADLFDTTGTVPVSSMPRGASRGDPIPGATD
jgi:hypothetical protein